MQLKKNLLTMIISVLVIVFVIFLIWNHSAFFKRYYIAQPHLNFQTYITNDNTSPYLSKKMTLAVDEINAYEKVKTMSLDEKIGQLVIGGLNGTTMSEETAILINDYNIGGFIFLSQNLETPQQAINLLNELKLANSENPLPLFLSVDQEGGLVTRLPQLEHVPSPSHIAENFESEKAYQYGQLLGEQLHAFGFQVNFAPVLDINNNPNNPVIGSRSFGTTPHIVSQYGIET